MVQRRQKMFDDWRSALAEDLEHKRYRIIEVDRIKELIEAAQRWRIKYLKLKNKKSKEKR